MKQRGALERRSDGVARLLLPGAQGFPVSAWQWARADRGSEEDDVARLWIHCMHDAVFDAAVDQVDARPGGRGLRHAHAQVTVPSRPGCVQRLAAAGHQKGPEVYSLTLTHVSARELRIGGTGNHTEPMDEYAGSAQGARRTAR